MTRITTLGVPGRGKTMVIKKAKMKKSDASGYLKPTQEQLDYLDEITQPQPSWVKRFMENYKPEEPTMVVDKHNSIAFILRLEILREALATYEANQKAKLATEAERMLYVLKAAEVRSMIDELMRE